VRKILAQLRDKLSGCRRLAVVGIGSFLRSDDAAGMIAAEGLAGFQPKSGIALKAFLGGAAPENLTGQIKTFKPTHILLVDAASLGEKAGAVKVFSPEQTAGVCFCTHQMPLKILADYLREALSCAVEIIGIQPKSLAFGEKVSREVKRSAEAVAQAIKRVIAGI
jgi:hydrogenase 3 maturation protease